VVGHERHGVERGALAQDLEVQVVAGGGAGGPLNPEDLPGGDCD